LSASDRRLAIDVARVTPAMLQPAATWLAEGGIVAYPTDTFYGLAADPASAEALRRLFDLKGRALDVAVPLIASSREQVEQSFGALVGPSARLAAAFWPGPLSLVLDAPSWMTSAVHGGRGTAAVRVPDHAVARALADAFGRPVTATSANRSGDQPAAEAAALAWLGADPRVFVIDAGPTQGGAPSTIVDARGDVLVCVRAGAIAWDRVLTSQ
jgi:L-threonylcarbamoyladenylate synthase